MPKLRQPVLWPAFAKLVLYGYGRRFDRGHAMVEHTQVPVLWPTTCCLFPMTAPPARRRRQRPATAGCQASRGCGRCYLGCTLEHLLGCNKTVTTANPSSLPAVAAGTFASGGAGSVRPSSAGGRRPSSAAARRAGSGSAATDVLLVDQDMQRLGLEERGLASRVENDF